MLKIYGDREYFYQWDLNQKLVVAEPSVKEVHFANYFMDEALVVEVKEGLVEVPNIMLQQNLEIKAYGYCGDCHTLFEKTFEVKYKMKPADYVYTETEVKSYALLDKRIKALEETGGIQGEKGEPGEKGDPGEPGYTPVKGTDYWTEADKAEIVEDVLAAGSGAAASYTFDMTLMNLVPSDADKAVLEELYASRSKIERDLYVKSTSGTFHKIIRFNTMGGRITLYITKEDMFPGEVCGFGVNFNSDGTYKNIYEIINETESIKDWHWCEAREMSSIEASGDEHIKIVGYWYGDVNNIETFNISTSYGNSFGEENGSSYNVMTSQGGGYFANSGGSLSFWSYEHGDNFVNNGWSFLGYYYWG